MKHHLNTLFITTEGTYLAKQGEAVLVRQDGQIRLRVPLHTLSSIVCFGRVGLSPALMGLCGKRGVAISLLNRYGGLLARVNGFTSGNVLLRRQQYRLADDPAGSAGIARCIIFAKVANARSVLLRFLRDYPDAPGASAVQSAVDYLADNLRQAESPADLERLRGAEGDSANVYFSVFDHLITGQKPDFAFTTRSRRPPLDRVNALLSFLYAMLAHDARTACEAAGLDAAVGFLHRDRPGRPGLALDLMEELGPFLCDRLALSLINRRQVQPGGFVITPTGAVRMDDATRKAVLSAYQRRKQEELVHPFLGQKVSVGLVVHLQARLLARHVRGDLDAYPAFVWK